MSKEESNPEKYNNKNNKMTNENKPVDVQLTKFAPLANDDQQPHFVINLSEESLNTNTETSRNQTSTNCLKSTSASQLIGCNDQETGNRKSKWPWFSTNTKQHPLRVEAAGTLHSLSSQQVATLAQRTTGALATIHARDPFQVVWRRLSFEVSPGTYEQFINGASNKLRSLLSPFSSSKRAKSATTLDNKSGANEKNESVSSHRSYKRTRRVIFENLNGYVNSGEISAIIGPSGSGKTSLLNAICGRIENYRGSVQLHGGGKRRMRLSIIPQKDYLIENLSVRENLLYSSKILNTKSNFDHDANILRVIKMLNLTNCIESNAANISGGEYKRVSIAQELLRQPDILILDEPTSGLDSLNCKNLIKSLVQLIEASREGRINPMAIVMTIHQPDVETFQMFDHVYCLARHGRVVFDGHPSEAMNVIKNFACLTEEQLPASSMVINPANLLIEIASEDLFGREPVERLARLQRKQFELKQATFSGRGQGDSTLTSQAVYPQLLNAGLVESTLVLDENTNENSNQLRAATHRPQPSPNESLGDLSASSTLSSKSSSNIAKEGHLVRDKRLNAKNDLTGQFFYHTRLLSKRAFTSTIRDPLMTIISMMFHLSIPFVMWTVYPKNTGTAGACPAIQREMDMVSMVSNITMNKIEYLQEELTLALECSTMFFLATYSFSMCSLSIAALAFPLNMHILLKEVRNGWYSLPSYVVAKTIANFPFEVLFPVISLVMIYLMLDMPDSQMHWRLLSMALVMALVSMISHTQGLVFGALCMDSVQTAIFLASASSLPLTLLSGFTARIKHMPNILQKLSWLSLYRYSSDSINIIRFGYGICPCDSTTDDYLRHKSATFVDVPVRMRPLFSYYLYSSGTSSDETNSAITNGTEALNNTLNSIYSSSSSARNLIPGVSYDLTLNSSARSELLEKIGREEVDIFGQMANLMARSFTYGRSIDNCDTYRSQLLTTAGAPKDETLPMLFGGMMALLVAAKIILFVIVKYKIGSRI